MVDAEGIVKYDSFSLSRKLADNLSAFKKIFEGDDTVIFREFENHAAPAIKCFAISIDGMINIKTINESIVTPIVFTTSLNDSKNVFEDIKNQVVCGNDIKNSADIKSIVTDVLYGDTALFVEGFAEALIINTKGFSMRSISEPDDEKSLRGPREGFTEGILTNTSMIRRKIQTSDLKFSFIRLGNRTNTKTCICYLDSLVKKDMLEDLRKRISKINIDGLLDSHYIAQLIKDSPYSLLKTIGTTEKPDIAAAKLLEGRIVILLDGSPMALTLPYLLIENFQAPDDYYSNFYYASATRILRLLSFFITISIPALYIALVAFHQEMIPTSMLVSIVSAAKGVPFPAIVECIGMLMVFEILNETGIRMPNKIGQALSIVGALVIGQAAVEAKIVSAPMIIVIAITGITGLMVPRMKAAVFVFRLVALAGAASFGIFGYFIVMLWIMIYMLSIKSFGIDITSQFGTFSLKDIKDIYIASPQQLMKTRPRHMSTDETRGK